jgi:hypothetical protein
MAYGVVSGTVVVSPTLPVAPIPLSTTDGLWYIIPPDTLSWILNAVREKGCPLMNTLMLLAASVVDMICTASDGIFTEVCTSMLSRRRRLCKKRVITETIVTSEASKDKLTATPRTKETCAAVSNCSLVISMFTVNAIMTISFAVGGLLETTMGEGSACGVVVVVVDDSELVVDSAGVDVEDSDVVVVDDSALVVDSVGVDVEDSDVVVVDDS